jgi:hypothetical protein
MAFFIRFSGFGAIFLNGTFMDRRLSNIMVVDEYPPFAKPGGKMYIIDI